MKKMLLLAFLTAITANLFAQDHEYHLVISKPNGNIVKYDFTEAGVENIYSTLLNSDGLLGNYDDPWATYPDLPIYIEIDGKHYGPADDMTSANTEDHIVIPLFENNNWFNVPTGFGHEVYIISIENDSETGSFKMYADYTTPCDSDIHAEAPNITYRITNDAVIITAISNEGYIRMTVDGVIVDNPCTIVRGEEDSTITVTAIAREFYKPESEPTTLDITVPARENAHDRGHWVVLLDKDGNEVWYELKKQLVDYDFYLTNVTLDYETYSNDWGPESETWPFDPLVYFYFSIDGIRYGAEEEALPAILGFAIQNPLFTNDYFYTIPAGYSYVIGDCCDKDGNLYVYVAIPTHSIDEMENNGKVVANVRYYNIMGQEMQEANGLTIVVTTYTDGSHSAVKVIK